MTTHGGVKPLQAPNIYGILPILSPLHTTEKLIQYITHHMMAAVCIIHLVL